MFVIDYPLLRSYIYRCFRLMTNEQRIAMFYYNVQMKQLHEDMVKLMPEQAKGLHSTINEQPGINQKPTEELFKFIHPEIEEKEAWRIHWAIKRLVVNYGLQDIYNYLKKLAKEEKIYLPQDTERAYNELVRMGMSDKEGYSLKTFRNIYRR